MNSRNDEQRVIVAMGYRDEGWTSSWLHADQLAKHLTMAGVNAALFAPQLGQNVRWWHRRLLYSRTLPAGDLFHLVDPAYADSLKIARRQFKAVVATVTDIAFWRYRTLLNTPFRAAIIRGLRQANYRVAISKKTAVEMESELGLRADQVIYLGTEPDIFRFNARARDATLMLHVGTVTPRKGIDRILRLLPHLPESIRLAQIGGQFDAGHRQLIANFGLSHRVSQIPSAPIERLVEAYQTAGLFVFPSRYEGYGVPCVEARLCGATVALTDAVPAREVLEGDASTHVTDFAAFDPIEADGPCGSALNDRRGRVAAEMRARFAQSTADLPERNWYSWNRVASEYQDLYRRLGSKRQ